MKLNQHDIDKFVEGAKKRNADGLHSEGDLIVIAMAGRVAKMEAVVEAAKYICPGKPDPRYHSPGMFALREAIDALEE